MSARWARLRSGGRGRRVRLRHLKHPGQREQRVARPRPRVARQTGIRTARGAHTQHDPHATATALNDVGLAIPTQHLPQHLAAVHQLRYNSGRGSAGKGDLAATGSGNSGRGPPAISETSVCVEARQGQGTTTCRCGPGATCSTQRGARTRSQREDPALATRNALEHRDVPEQVVTQQSQLLIGARRESVCLARHATDGSVRSWLTMADPNPGLCKRARHWVRHRAGMDATASTAVEVPVSLFSPRGGRV
jgi:hypothetical protein